MRDENVWHPLLQNGLHSVSWLVLPPPGLTGSGLVMVASSWKGSLESGSCSSVSVVTTSASKLGVFVFSSVLWCVVVISAGESPWNMSS